MLFQLSVFNTFICWCYFHFSCSTPLSFDVVSTFRVQHLYLLMLFQLFVFNTFIFSCYFNFPFSTPLSFDIISTFRVQHIYLLMLFKLSVFNTFIFWCYFNFQFSTPLSFDVISTFRFPLFFHPFSLLPFLFHHPLSPVLLPPFPMTAPPKWKHSQAS